MSSSARDRIPLRERKLDYVFLCFFALSLSFITYIVDIEQIIITDPRPAWWRATIWIDALLFGPFAMVLLANAAWWLFPMFSTARMWRAGEHPFTRALR